MTALVAWAPPRAVVRCSSLPQTRVGAAVEQPPDLAVGLVLGGATLAGAAGGAIFGYRTAGAVGSALGVVGGAWIGGMAGIFLALLLWGL